MKAPASRPPDRKAEIIRRLEAGESAPAIANALGITRQYVSAIKVQWAREGADAVLARDRHGPRPRRPLSPAEEAALHQWIAAGRPTSDGAPPPRWTAAEAIAWFKRTYKRPIGVQRLRRFCAERGLRLALSSAEIDAIAAELFPKPARPPDAAGPGPNAATATTARTIPVKRTRRRSSPDYLSELDIARMEQANAETARRMQAARETTAAGAKPAPVQSGPKLGRNDPCPLDPGRKFKRCCGASGATRCLRDPASA